MNRRLKKVLADVRAVLRKWSRPVSAPPLGTALLCYFAGLLILFAVPGVIAMSGNPLGILAAFGTVALAHIAPLIDTPTGNVPLDLAAMAAFVAAIWWLQAKLRNWWRIAVTIGGLLAWFLMGCVIMGHWT